MNDFSKMPFGQHKGTLMANVPDDHLKWLWGENKVAYKLGQLRGEKFWVMRYIDEYMGL